MKKALFGAAVALVALGGFAGAGTASAARGPTSFHVLFPNSEPRAILDEGRPGPSAGDVFFFYGKLTDDAGNRVGKVMAKATMFRARQQVAYIEATLLLSQGNLSAEGRIDFNRRQQGTLTVTGGTGSFTGASGTARSIAGKVITIQVDLTY